MLNATIPYNTAVQTNIQRGYVQSLRERERAKMEEYIKAREYYDGIHETQLTDRLRQFLNVYGDGNFNANYCPMVVNAKADRLIVNAFESEEEEQNDILWRWWRKNRMDRKQNVVHRQAVRDGDAFVLVEWDTDADMPRFYVEPAFAGDGVMVYYSEERRDEIEFASKHWRIQYGANAGKMRRMNLYYPNRIEKYVSHDSVAGGLWRPHLDENKPPDDIRAGMLGQAAVHWWTDDGTETGEPLGVPVVHFKHNDCGDGYGRSHLADVMPLQDVVNKTMIDLIASSDSAGFGLLVGYGTEAWTGAQVGPGAIAAVSQPPTEAKLERLPGDSPTGLMSVYNAMVMEIARISGTPLSYFQLSGQVAAEGTLKQQEIALISQVQKAQVDFGNGWEDCMRVARRLHNAFSDAPGIDTDAIIDTVWEPAQIRNEKEQAEVLDIQVNKLGVSEEQAWINLGYDATQRAKFARAQMRGVALGLRQQARTPAVDEPDTQPEADNAQDMTQTENEADEAERTQAA